MGDDPYIDALADNRSAQIITVESLGKGAWALLTAAMVLSAISIAYAMVANDRSYRSEREARIAQDSVTHMQIELAKRGIFISVDEH